MSGDIPSLTLTLPAADWQLLMQVAQQALLPYQRLGQVLQAMQSQAQASAQRANGDDLTEGRL